MHGQQIIKNGNEDERRYDWEQICYEKQKEQQKQDD